METIERFIKAIQEGRLQEVQQLATEQPALSEYTTPSGVPVSMLAAYYQQWDIFKWLMTQGRTPNIYEAAAGGMEVAVRQLLAADPALVNAFASDGFTPLGLAAYFKRPALVRLLIEHGADVNQPANNPARVAPIHSAVAANSVAITRHLLEHGAQVDALQHGGISALHAAAHRGNPVLVQLLLQYGADPGLCTEDGRSALDFARADGHKKIERILSA